MNRYDGDQTSIFPRPSEDEPDRGAPPPAAEPPQTPDQPIRAHPAPEFDPAERTRHEGLSRQVIVLGSMGLAILALSGFIGVSLLRSDADPAAAAVQSPSLGASPSETRSPDPTPDPTPSPVPTPEPTPAGPPAEVAPGGWATVTVGELNVRSGAGSDQASVYRLVRGAVVNVVEGPATVDGESWYRVASLGGATGWASSGWEIEPYLQTVANDPTLSACGQIRRAVFNLADGAATPDDVLRIGEFALPASAFRDVTLGAAELLRGMGQEMCFTARVGADGLPQLSTQLAVTACGRAVPDGRLYRLEPTDDDEIPLASQVMEATVLHPALLLGGPADNRMSSNIATVVSMLANDGTSGCLAANVTQRGEAIDASTSASARQCSVVHVYNEHSLKLSPASGGPEAWIKLTASDFERGRFPIEQPVQVSIDAYVNDGDPWANAWPYGSCS